MNKVTPIGAEWNEVRKELYSPEKIAASDLLETATDIKQLMLARIESGATDPQLSTLLKVLAPLRKTLEVVPLK